VAPDPVPALLRILHLVVVAALLTTVTGLATMASATIEAPCCPDEEPPRNQAPEHGLAAADCSAFCFSCPSRTVAPPQARIAPIIALLVVAAPAPALAFAAPTDPPRRGVFHPPRPSLGTSSLCL
jgi:hypothetical protein